MNQISSRNQNVDDAVCQAANDNHTPGASECSILDLIPSEADFADISRRAERLGIAVVIGMAICWLLVAPVVYLVLIHGVLRG